jgi:phage/plasmid-associated DNA primase
VMARIFMSCNDLPGVPTNDGGTWRRIIVIPHVARFVDPAREPVDAERHVYAKDLHLEDNMRQWRSAFLSLLVHYYETRYVVHGLVEPKQVTAESDKYRAMNDALAQFVSDTVVFTADERDSVPLNTMWESYAEWYKVNGGGAKRLKKSDLTKQLRDFVKGRTGRPQNLMDRLTGVRMLTAADASGGETPFVPIAAASPASAMTAPAGAQRMHIVPEDDDGASAVTAPANAVHAAALSAARKAARRGPGLRPAAPGSVTFGPIPGEGGSMTPT